jgi:hypothetical protein
MSDATERRYAAIREATEAFLDAGNDYAIRESVTRESVAAHIDTLRPLGRTARWAGALDKWRAWVLDENTDLRWAIVQGSIGAGHGAR